MNLAQVIYDSFPNSEDLDIEPDDLQDLKTLYHKVVSKPSRLVGDGLFCFLVIEAYEGGSNDDGSIDIDMVKMQLERDMSDIQEVLNGIEAEEEMPK